MSKEKWPQHLWDEAGWRLRGFSGKRFEERSGVQRIEFNGIGIIQAQSRHTTTLDPLAVFEEIMKRMPQLDIQDRSRDNHRKVGSENQHNL